jgi:DNA invertase Pin-like site-specific DNA recombinase
METIQKFYIYARKSTDVEDKQVLSIEAQLVELREYAKREEFAYCRRVYRKEISQDNWSPYF